MLNNFGAGLGSELTLPSRGSDNKLVEFKRFFKHNSNVGEVYFWKWTSGTCICQNIAVL